MSTKAKKADLARRVSRDHANAKLVSGAAAAQSSKARVFKPERDMVRGTAVRQIAIAQAIDRGQVDLQKIAQRAFDAMVEVATDAGAVVLWYAHRDTSGNQSIATPAGDVRVLSWTHPGIQAGLSAEIGDEVSVKRAGYVIKSVTPIARARFECLVPEVAGVYDPGGRIGESAPTVASTSGLKAVKLEMTAEQVQAFITRMRGVLIVTGAPGTGKTTVAFQRIRFLFDQQDLRDPEELTVPYEPELTRVFLASRNLIAYSRSLLRDELRVPADVVAHVADFVRQYVERVWQPKLDARLITKKTTPEELRAREAFLNLGEVSDLREMWRTLEIQARARLALSVESEWKRLVDQEGGEAAKHSIELAATLAEVPARAAADPQDSVCRMDSVWRLVRRPYESCRSALATERKRDEFDGLFARWLLHAYDPLDTLVTHFSNHRDVAARRIVAGTGGLADPRQVVDQAIEGWRKRLYGVAELAWIAWILRFALPEQSEPDDGFRAVPRAISRPNHKTERRWMGLIRSRGRVSTVESAFVPLRS